MQFSVPGLESSGWWPVVAAAAAVGWWLLRPMSAARRTSNAERPATSPGAGAAEASRAAQCIQVELHETARALEARIDSKLVLLEQLIRDADERLARWETVRDAAESVAAGDAASTSSSAVLRGPHFAVGGAPPPLPTLENSPGRCAAVYAMADAGNNAAAIANRLGTPIGEVELILSLRSRRG